MKKFDSSTLYDSKRPVYALFTAMLSLDGRTDIRLLESDELFEHADTAVLKKIVTSASTLQRTFNLGISAIGRCLALAAPDATDKTQCDPDAVEAIGWLLAELSDFSAIAHHYEAEARRNLMDRRPP